MGEARSGKISLKLLVDRNENKVIFGEAGKDFVDFLFHFLSLPVGTVVKLLSKNKMVGSLGKIYGSIQALNTSYLEPNVDKDHVLNPKVYSSLRGAPLLLGNKSDADELNGTKIFYRCNRGCAYMSNNMLVTCANCGNHSMSVPMTYMNKSPENEEAAEIGKGGGFVKELVNYMVMDDLVVKPMSTISSISLLSKVKDMSAVETLEIYIGKNEAVDLLKASFVTDQVLTSLFLGKQSPYKPSAHRKRSKKGD
ncbi:Tyramine N-feruloyltransferase [Heracleum sosnowskyi]|uniref:Tyramine N-feruloyltransferase n=1 Tax=Heracleum sosnowskyi TaxID=360622 RepID=A0AAD8M0U3_9APIA|nr:Tyramine N-feruloyltransferase [Heracleum sosnowskyi]